MSAQIGTGVANRRRNRVSADSVQQRSYPPVGKALKGVEYGDGKGAAYFYDPADNRTFVISDNVPDLLATPPVEGTSGVPGLSIHSPESLPASEAIEFVISGGFVKDVSIDFSNVEIAEGRFGETIKSEGFLNGVSIGTDQITLNDNGALHILSFWRGWFDSFTVTTATGNATADLAPKIETGAYLSGIAISGAQELPAQGSIDFRIDGGTATAVELDFTSIVGGSGSPSYALVDVMGYLDNATMFASFENPGPGSGAITIDFGVSFNRINVANFGDYTADVSAAILSAGGSNGGGSGSGTTCAIVSATDDGSHRPGFGPANSIDGVGVASRRYDSFPARPAVIAGTQAQPRSLTIQTKETMMPREPKAYQFDLFANREDNGGLKTPPWRTLPAATRQTIMTQMTRLILDDADKESAEDRREAAHHDV